MTRSWPHILFGLLLAVTLVVSGALSARQMGPDRDKMMAEASLAALGGSLADLCQTDGGPAHVHDCPFCHKLPEAQSMAFTPAASRVVHRFVANLSPDLVTGPQTHGLHRTARAPPRTA